MITGAHNILYSSDAEATRAFFRDVLELKHVDAGDGWLIFGLPPAEFGVHPSENPGRCELYLTCDDLDATRRELEAKGAVFRGDAQDMGWGKLLVLDVPGVGDLGIYEPRHPTTFDL